MTGWIFLVVVVLASSILVGRPRRHRPRLLAMLEAGGALEASKPQKRLRRMPIPIMGRLPSGCPTEYGVNRSLDARDGMNASSQRNARVMRVVRASRPGDSDGQD